MTNKINSVIRQQILNLFISNNYKWCGRLNNIDFFKRIKHIFDIDELKPSNDRYQDFAEEVWQHTINNDDWDENWVFSNTIINLLWIEDFQFQNFIVQSLHPAVTENPEEARTMFIEINKLLKKEKISLSLISIEQLGDYSVYQFIDLQNIQSESKVKIYITPVSLQKKELISAKTIVKFQDESIVLFPTSWDDYSAKTTFLIYYKEKGELIEIGEIKILDLENKVNRFCDPEGKINLYADYFNKGVSELPKDKFISLGQSLDVYSKLHKYFGESIYEILNSLNDVVTNKKLLNKYRYNSDFIHSLLRSNEAQIALKEAKIILSNELVKYDEPDFKIKKLIVKLGDINSNEFYLNFNYGSDIGLPHRIKVIIGSNGTGKTQIIHQIAQKLLPKSDSSARSADASFIFSKVIYISYGVFDTFKYQKLEEGNKSEFQYCGLYEEKDGKTWVKTKSELFDKVEKKLKLIIDRGRFSEWARWVNILSPTIDTNKIYLLITEFKPVDFFIHLSSGQSMLVSLLTDILSFIRNNSFILIDEPETHLHPNALSKFMTLLNEILELYNSYALIATHSGIVLQSIPSKHVNVFSLIDGDIIKSSDLKIESFGENLNKINSEVFGFENKSEDELNTYYKKIFKELSEKYSINQIFEEFEKTNILSLSAKLYLEDLYDQSDNT